MSRRVPPSVRQPAPAGSGLIEPCLIWQGSTTSKGYGQRNVGGRIVRVHRHAYEEAHGPIPDGLQVDHLCEVKRCHEVTHLEAVTALVNMRRGPTSVRLGETRETCKRGHGRNNLVWRKSGARFVRRCCVCHREAERDRQNRRKEAA